VRYSILCSSTFDIEQKMEKSEFRVLIKHCFIHPPYSPDLAPSDYFLFSDLKRMLAGKKFKSDDEVISETEAYFDEKEKSYFRGGIEKLENRFNRCIALEGNYIE